MDALTASFGSRLDARQGFHSGTRDRLACPSVNGAIAACWNSATRTGRVPAVPAAGAIYCSRQPKPKPPKI